MTNRGKAIGVYIPPVKLRAMRETEQKQKQEQQANEEQTDRPPLGKNTEEKEDGQVLGNAEIAKQRESWNKLKKTINGSINRLNLSNIRDITVKLFGEANLARGRGLLARSLLKAVLASPAFAHVYAALIAVISAKLPENGELVLCRAIYAFKRSFQRRDKGAALALVKFIAHLVNQSVAHELLALQILTVLLEDPTEDGVEIATALTLELGQFLEEVSPKGMHAVMERFRSILHQGDVDSRVQYAIENLFAIRKGGFEQYPAIVPDLDLVEREDQITFETGLDDDIEKQELLDIFRLDDKFEEGEILWGKIRSEILGDDESSGDDDDDDDDDSEEEEDDNGTKEGTSTALTSKNTTIVHDLTEEDLIHLRRTIYLTIMSAATFEECAHKLARINIPIGKEHELVNMLIECCSQERTFLRYYGLISQRFCLMHFRWRNAFTQSFHEQYMTVHRLETNKLRNVAKLFAHLLHTDALSWSEALTTIHLNEDETTSSSRIFIKILVQEMAEAMGIARLKERLTDPEMQEEIKGLFPKDASKPRDTRYAINFFTSIGLGPLTDDLREFLKNAPKLIMAQAQAVSNRGNDDNSTVSPSSSSSGSTTSSSTSGSSRSSSSSGSSQSYSSSSFTSRSSSTSRSRRRGRSRGRHRRRSRSSSSSSSSSSSRSSSTSSRSSHSSGRRKVRSESPSSHHRSRSRRNRHRSASPTIRKDDRNRSRRSRSVSKSPTEEMPKDGHNNSSRSKLPVHREGRTRRRRNSGTESSSGQSRSSSRSISRSPTTSSSHRTKRGGISRGDSHSRSFSREKGSGKYKRSRSSRGRGEYTSRRSRSLSVSPDTERNKRHRVGQMPDTSRDIVQSDRSSYMGREKPNPDVDDFGRAIRRPMAHD